jgi:hypothetical protein
MSLSGTHSADFVLKEKNWSFIAVKFNFISLLLYSVTEFLSYAAIITLLVSTGMMNQKKFEFF